MQFHEGFGEMTAEDVKFTVEQNLKPDSQGGSAPFFRTHLDRIETPDKHTVVMHFKNRVWEVPSNFTQFVGYQNITSKKYIESVGEDKAALHPIGTGPFRHVEGKQGDYHRFEAIANHWRKTPAFKELVIRRIPDPATRLAGLRSGEIDIGNVFGDYLDQAKKAGLRIHEAPNAACHWVVCKVRRRRTVKTTARRVRGRAIPSDPKSLENARKVRLALNLAVNKKTIISALWKGLGSDAPFMYWYLPFHKGFKTDWKVPPYDPERAKKLLAEAGHAGGFEVRMNPLVMTYALDGPDMVEAVALDWEKVGIKVRRVPEAFSNFLPKNRARKTNKTHWVYGSPPFDEPVPRLAANDPHEGRVQSPLRRSLRRRRRHDLARARRREARAADPGARPEALRRLPRRDARGAVNHVGGEQEGQQLADPGLRAAREQLRIRELIEEEGV